jgi:hypothetical protein
MRLHNNSDFPDEKLKEIFDFCAKPLGIKGMTVKVYGGKLRGNYAGLSCMSKSEVLIGIGFNIIFPWFWKKPEKKIIKSKDRWEETKREVAEDGRTYIYYKKKAGYVDKYRENPHLSMLLLSKDEFIVQVLAHELRHQWQRKIRPMKEYTHTVRHLGSKSYFRRERDAEAYALNRLRAWRKLHSVDIYPEQPDKLYDHHQQDQEIQARRQEIVLEIPN